MYLGDMVVNTGYPVMMVIMAVITKTQMSATVLTDTEKENIVCSFCICTGEVISLISRFQIIGGLKKPRGLRKRCNKARLNNFNFGLWNLSEERILNKKQ